MAAPGQDIQLSEVIPLMQEVNGVRFEYVLGVNPVISC